MFETLRILQSLRSHLLLRNMDAAQMILDDLKTSTVNVEFKDLLVFFLGLARRGDQEGSGPEPSPESLTEDCVRKIIELQTSKKEAFDEIIHHLQIPTTFR